MKKIKFLSVLLILIFVFTLSSCKKSFEDFKEIVEKDITNATINMDFKVAVSANGLSEEQTMNVKMELDQNRSMTTVQSGDSKEITYSEERDNKVSTWIKKPTNWAYQGEISSASNQDNIPVVEVEEGDFVYKKGLWVGDCDKLEDKILDVIDLQELVGFNGQISNLEIERYDIKLNKDDISEIYIVLKFSMPIQSQNINIKLDMTVTMEKIGRTKVERPENLN